MNCTQLNSLKGWLIKKLPKKRNECCPECVCMVFRRRACCSLSGSHWTHLQPPWRQMFGCWQPSKSVSLGWSFPADVEKVVAKQPQRAKGSSWDDFPLTLSLLYFGSFNSLNKQCLKSALQTTWFHVLMNGTGKSMEPGSIQSGTEVLKSTTVAPKLSRQLSADNRWRWWREVKVTICEGDHMWRWPWRGWREETYCLGLRKLWIYCIEWVPYVVRILTPDWICGLQIILPFCRLPFHFVGCFLCYARVF